MVDFVRDHKRCALWADMGLGKSSATLFILDLLRLLGVIGDSPTLVVGPMRVARDTWPDEVAKWSDFASTRIMPLNGTPTERVRRLQTPADIYTISYELLPWLVEHYHKRWPFRQVVADEADRLKGFRLSGGGQRAHAIARLAHTLVERWVNLTGTPQPLGLQDLWGQTWYLDKGERLGRTYTAFMQRWFRPKWNGHGIEPLPNAAAEIHALIRDICITIDPRDYFDLREPIQTPVMVHLPPKARQIYDELEKKLFAEFDGERVEVFNDGALTNKCLQIANGAVYTDYPKWAPIHDAKIEAVESILSEASSSPLLVAYSFKSDLARLLAAFPKAAVLSSAEGMARFKAGGAALGLAHPASMGHGIDGLQQHCHRLVRFGHTWNLGLKLQMLGRIGPVRQMQAGFDRPVYVSDIIATDTLDEIVIASDTDKLTSQRATLDYMNRRRQ